MRSPDVRQRLPVTHENTHIWLLPLLPQGKKHRRIVHQRGYTCVVPPRGYTCGAPPRHVAAVTTREAFSTTGYKRVLGGNNIVWVGFQEICRRLQGTLRYFLLPQKTLLPTAHSSYLCVTVAGNVHPCCRYTTKHI